MPETTNEQLRQYCEQIIGWADHRIDAPLVIARALLSRLDREAEAERKLRALERKVEAFMISIPQTYGEVKQLTGQWPPCEGHEWDNRTTAENAAWCLFSLLEAERRLKVAREALGYYDRGTDWAEMDGSIAHNALAEIAPAAPEGEQS